MNSLFAAKHFPATGLSCAGARKVVQPCDIASGFGQVASAPIRSAESRLEKTLQAFARMALRNVFHALRTKQ